MGIVKNFGNNLGIKRKRGKTNTCFERQSFINIFLFILDQWDCLLLCHMQRIEEIPREILRFVMLSYLLYLQIEVLLDAGYHFWGLGKRISVNHSQLSLPMRILWWPKMQSHREKCCCFEPWKNRHDACLSIGSKQ